MNLLWAIASSWTSRQLPKFEGGVGQDLPQNPWIYAPQISNSVSAAAIARQQVLGSNELLLCHMLIPLTRRAFEEVIPAVATAEQYRYCWGKPRDLLRRLLVSVVAVVGIVLLDLTLGRGFEIPMFVLGITAGLYWLWIPVYLASRRNAECRKYEYAGFWQGEVRDVFITEELIGTEETVNKRGELVIVENRERCLNMEIGDDSGFVSQVQVPLQRAHRVVRPGDLAEMVVMSNRPDLSRVTRTSDIFLSDYNLWVSDYPYLRRDVFLFISRKLRQQGKPPDPRKSAGKRGDIEPRRRRNR